jgi:hypothetical protein
VVKAQLGSPILTGIFLLALSGVRYATLQTSIRNLQALPGVTATIGNGFWIGVIGSSMVVLGGAMIQSADRVG